ncbi:pyridoxal-dependent decarboxylase, exosortase A system-associated [uncultured Piscinibacter sp.]|uniref:pyridoxal-dependent decarboxylase, exosortase A system-associated n=1 Tax=uncultured Piscinibacter sp. TaxID=1131835 RepID=UPI0026090C5D|nr:pyridoxal-dependent decarboxylase, exosortase A system-associated [uncultured Piscinibacter sp.]
MSAERHSAAARFPVVDGELTIGGVRVSVLAARVGGTPFYAYDRQLLSARVAELRRVLPEGISLHYAMKANPMPAVVQHMARLVDGLDVASSGELRVAMDTGLAPAEISFAGPGKSDGELSQAVASGVLVNAESTREIAVLADCSQRLGMPARVAVRVNPDFELKSSGMKMGGGPKQFGIDAEQVPRVLRDIGRLGLSFEGFHIYSGSQNLRADSICEAQRKVLDLAVRLAGDAPAPVRLLNLGGGFGIPYFPGEKPLDVQAVGAHLHSVVQDATERLPGARLVIELGRYLVGEAGVYVCRVVDRKISRGEVFLVTDGGLHHHLAASGNFGQVIRKNYPVEIATRPLDAPRQRSSVVGPLCTPLDLLADRAELATADAGDLVAVFQSGAYGPSASPSAFLSHPRSLEMLV